MRYFRNTGRVHRKRDAVWRSFCVLGTDPSTTWLTPDELVASSVPQHYERGYKFVAPCEVDHTAIGSRSPNIGL